jgi:hypothetical protein
VFIIHFWNRLFENTTQVVVVNINGSGFANELGQKLYVL